MNKNKADPGVNKVISTGIDAVADDRNWIGRIQNELNCNAMWEKDWGFLAGGVESLDKEEAATKTYTIDEKIQMIQQQIAQLKYKGDFKTTYKEYGLQEKLEKFQTPEYNITRTNELKACDRKLKKDFKKEKWKCPEDPFDPLKNMFKKKK